MAGSMATPQSQLDYLYSLYNASAAIAERVDPSVLADIHLPTPLDARIEAWINDGQDVILTGNPGDGKTHLIKYLDQQGRLVRGSAEPDASERQSADILETWMQQRRKREPYVLAINHAPLRRLAEEATRNGSFDDLRRIPAAIDQLIYYNERPEDILPSIMLVH